MGLQPAVTEHKSRANNIIVRDIIICTHAHVMAHTAHFAFRGLVGELGENRVTGRIKRLANKSICVINIKAFGPVHATADVMTVVEAIAGKEVPTLEAIVGREACPVHPRIACTHVDSAVEALAFVFLQDDIDDARRAFCVVTYRGVGDDLDSFNHVALQGTQGILGAHTRKPRFLAIDEDTHAVVATQANVAFHVDRDGRDIFQHLNGIAGSVGDIFTHVEDAFVKCHLVGTLLCHHVHLAEHTAVGRKADSSYVDGCFRAVEGDILVFGDEAHVLHLKHITAFIQLQLKSPGRLRDAT